MDRRHFQARATWSRPLPWCGKKPWSMLAQYSKSAVVKPVIDFHRGGVGDGSEDGNQVDHTGLHGCLTHTDSPFSP